MRLLIVTPEYPPHQGGGIAKYYGTLAPALVRAGATVTVVVASPFSDAFPDYEHDGVRVHAVSRSDIDRRSDDMPHLSATPRFRRSLAAARAARDRAAAIGAFDCVEATDFALQFVPFLLDDGPPVVVQCHGSTGQISLREPRRAEYELDHALTRMTEAMLLPAAEDVQTYSAANATEWAGRLARPVRVIPPPLAPEDADWTPGEAGLVIGRVQPWKGPEVLCRALRQLPEHASPRFVWVGRDTPTAPDGGSCSEWLRREYPDIWGTRIEPIGPRSYAGMVEVRRRSRMVVIPSEWDVFNLSAAEAMSAGCLVVCSDAAGAADLLEPGRNGFVCAAGDPGSLAESIRTAAALDMPRTREIGRHARETVIARLNPDVVARAHLAVLEGLAAADATHPQAPDWVRDFYSGHASGHVSAAFLGQVGIRDLSKHLATRLGRRLTARAGDRP